MKAPYHIVQRGKSKVWYIWWPKGGKKIWKRILTEDGKPLDHNMPRRLATKYAAIVYAQDSSYKSVPMEPFLAGKTSIVTHDDLINAYRKGKEHEWDALTIKQYANWFNGQKEFFGAATKVRDLTVQKAEAFRNWLLLDKGLASKTVTQRLALIRRVFQWAVDIGELDRNPFKIVKPPKAKPIRENDPFSPAEIQALLEAALEKFPWFYPCLLTASLTGARRNVLIHLKVKNINHIGKRLVVPPEIAKHDKRHDYALPDELYDLLCHSTAGENPDAPLFPTKAGKQMSTKTFDLYVDKNGSAHLWRRLLETAKVKPRGVHNLRSAVDTNLVAAGVSLDLAISVTGHTREVAEKHYLRIDQEKQRQTITKLAALYKWTSPDKLLEAVREVKISLTVDDAKTLKNWILSERSKWNSGANTGANFITAYTSLKNKELKNMAERQGFEPWIPFRGTLAFEASSFSHSDISPRLVATPATAPANRWQGRNTALAARRRFRQA